MSNKVTHIAEIKPGLLPKLAEDYLKKAAVILNGTYYLQYETSWQNNLEWFGHIASLMQGEPFHVYVFDEEPRCQIGEATIMHGGDLYSQIYWYRNDSEIAMKKYEDFSVLSTKIENAYTEQNITFTTEWRDPYEKDFRLLGMLTSVTTHLYIALGPDKRYYQSTRPTYINGRLAKENWSLFEINNMPLLEAITCTINLHDEGREDAKRLYVWLNHELHVNLEAFDLTRKLSSPPKAKKGFGIKFWR